jgi:MoaA/NifB/PqqE/SkfB family radical SAM enzyme
VMPVLGETPIADRSRTAALLLRGRIPKERRGTLPIDVVRRVVTDASPGLERIDLYQYGEPFLYRHLLDALRHIRQVTPPTTIAISTDGMQVRPAVEEAIASEELLDWLIFSIDGCDEDSYRRYRIGGTFDVAFRNMVSFFTRAAGTRLRVVWQYVVFEWNDRDEQFERAIRMAKELGITLWFDFAHTWGRSRRRPEDIRYLAPYLKPFTALPGEPRQEGW